MLVEKLNKVVEIDESRLAEYLANDFIVVEEKTEKAPQEKTFSQKGAGEQISVINATENIEDLKALLTENLKPTAKTALEAKIAKLEAGE